jgi:hypothetical protein
MIKNLAALEVTIENKIYKLICEADAPIGAVHDALTQMKSFVVNRINEAHKQEQPPPQIAEPPKQE